MSIPAVLYDHIPIDDLKHDRDARNEISGSSCVVSSMIHETSAPREEDDDDGNGDKTHKEFERSLFEENRNGRKNESKDELRSMKDRESECIKQIEVVQNDETEDRPMETIIEDIDSDYVQIPIPPPIMPYDFDNDLPSVSRTKTGIVRNKIKSFGRAFLRATMRSPELNRDRAANDSKVNGIITKCLSGCAAGSRALLRPFESYAKNLVSPSIYNSYDWVSETVIDSSGNRLILPGSCIALDSGCSRTSIVDGARKHSGDKENKGILIIRSGSDDIGLESGIQSWKGIPVVTSPSSSPWASNSIMVSAHDLIAVKYDQRVSPGDWDDLSMDRSTIVMVTTQNVTKQWIRTLWRLVQRKADVWYYVGQSYLKRSIRNAGLLFVDSRRLLIQYYRNNSRPLYLSLQTSNGRNACNNDHDENCVAEYNTSSMALSIPPEKLSDRLWEDKQPNDQEINECDVATRSSQYRFDLEMVTSISKERNNNHIAA